MREKAKKIIVFTLALMFVCGALISGIAVSTAGKKKRNAAA